MAFYKRRYRQRRNFRRRPYRKYRRSPKSFKHAVNRIINKRIEMKSYWNTFNEVSVNSLSPSAFYDSLLGISQGTAANARIGTQITVKGIHMNFGLHNNSATDVMYARVLLMWYWGDNVTFSSATSMFESTTDSTQDASAITGDNLMWWPIAKRHGFKPIYDKVVKLSPTNANTGSTADKRIRKFIKLNRKVNFNASGTTGLYNTPRLLFCVLSSQAANDDGTGIVVELTGFTRVFYQDA